MVLLQWQDNGIIINSRLPILTALAIHLSRIRCFIIVCQDSVRPKTVSEKNISAGSCILPLNCVA